MNHRHPLRTIEPSNSRLTALLWMVSFARIRFQRGLILVTSL